MRAPDQKVLSTTGDGLKSSNFIGRLSESINIMARPTMVTAMKLVDYIFLSKSAISLENCFRRMKQKNFNSQKQGTPQHTLARVVVPTNPDWISLTGKL